MGLEPDITLQYRIPQQREAYLSYQPRCKADIVVLKMVDIAVQGLIS